MPRQERPRHISGCSVSAHRARAPTVRASARSCPRCRNPLRGAETDTQLHFAGARAVDPSRSGEQDRLRLATVFAAVAQQRDGIATEPPVDVELRAATWRLEGVLGELQYPPTRLSRLSANRVGHPPARRRQERNSGERRRRQPISHLAPYSARARTSAAITPIGGRNGTARYRAMRWLSASFDVQPRCSGRDQHPPAASGAGRPQQRHRDTASQGLSRGLSAGS
jgi:hypothetical protein